MEENEVLKARINELSQRTLDQSVLCHTPFLSLSEQNVFFQMVPHYGSLPEKTYSGVPYVLFGGSEESDRKVLFFLPDYETEEELLTEERKGNLLTCLRISPKNVRFSDTLTHRDILGALMSLGYDRSYFGDILTDGTTSYVFLLSSIAEDIRSSLTSIRHTTVESETLAPSACPFHPQFLELSVTASSPRVDTLIKEVFHLSRRSAQELIGSENVFVDGLTAKNNALSLRDGQRVSVKGQGKFIFVGKARATRRGRFAYSVKLYH
jgi:RNA-binding protein YlmH